MKSLFILSALLLTLNAQAETAAPAANNAAYSQKIEQVFHGETLNRNIQLYRKGELSEWNREKAAGGTGALLGEFAYTRKQTDDHDAFREIGWMTLPPGAAIGLHKHENNEDVYIIISGKGIFTDSNGKESEVQAGDITIARPGQSHALKNAGDEPLVFLDLIAQTASATSATDEKAKQ